MATLVNLAKEILTHAEILEQQMKDANTPIPTLGAGGTLSYPKWSEHPEIFRTRTALVDASKAMFQLGLGPSHAIRSMIGPEKIEAFVLNFLNHYQVSSLVPKQGSITFEELASNISVQTGLLERIMRFAFSMNVFREEPTGSVSHTSLSEAMPELSGWCWLINRKEASSALSAWPAAAAVYSEPSIAGKRQMPWNIGNDTDLSFFATLNAEKDGMKNFGEAMRTHTTVAGGDPTYLFDGFDWASLGAASVVDLGGGNGHISITLAEKFSDLNFIIQDLPSSEELANALIPSHLKSRISFQRQDFFKPQNTATGAKVFMLRAIVHDWPDEDCVRILKNLIPEVERGAKILLVDRVTPPPGQKPTHMDSFVLFMDLLMFTLLGAKERNIDQFKALVQETDPRLKVLALRQPEGSEHGVVEVGFE